ncbi:hypothetical protein L3Y34_011785 [Caenorhabditis briggsae]|uniref:Uncharacterized protein n=2 Tax=Caenorhabditis briggsae TaxID=6238 RepID=A0AAE8ZQX3_CAEBR|nr:hypothetical protein L3Y34_011785 [Caenorhabditis briggsae]
MTPVVVVASMAKEDFESITGSLLTLGGVVLFFLTIYGIMVLYRHFYLGRDWCDSLSWSPTNPRVDRANRKHRREDVEATPKKATVVRFQINGKAFGNEDL